MIGKAVLDARLPGLAEANKIRCVTVCYRCNRRKDVPPNVRRSRVPVQKKCNRCFGISRFAVSHGGTENIDLRQCNIGDSGQ
jgi:hypothetical protein